MKKLFFVLALLPILIFVAACSQQTAELTPQNPLTHQNLPQATLSTQGMTKTSAELEETILPDATQTPEPKITSTDEEQMPSFCKLASSWDFVPRTISSQLLTLLNEEPLTMDDEPCTHLQSGNDNPVGEMVLALVAPFPTVRDEIASKDLKLFWQQGEAGDFDKLLLFPYAKSALTWLWGEPKGNVAVFEYPYGIEESEEQVQAMLKETWTSERTWAIISFDELLPRWKVIALDGQSPIHKSFNSKEYALTIPVSLYNEDSHRLENALSHVEQFSDLLPFSNFQSENLATVILTGVTAMARGTAAGMDERGILVPGEDLADVLREADLLHISNEVPFAENCPKQTVGGYLVLCSPESYMELLRFIGTDIVELTGDHFQDYGSDGMLFTLSLYEKEGWPVYGGGKDIFEAKAPVKLEVNGNKIAFLGCNAKSPNFAQASETSTGAYHCDMDYMVEATHQLVKEGYLPIVTFQHEERYDWSPNAQMIKDFGSVLEAGAVIASGSQAHQPHYAEFVQNGFAHYGLGNLFFDQYGIDTYTHWGFIDRHVFYNNRHISTELLTIRFLDRVKATWATPEQRIEMLEKIFDTARMQWKDPQPLE